MENDLQLIKSQLISGEIPPGSILARVLAELPASDVARLRSKAAEGMLALELQQMVMQNKFRESSIDIDNFIRNVRLLEAAHTGTTSGYTMTGRFETASGETTITSKKGCFIATAIYGSINHPNVLALRRFRDLHLETNLIGRAFCALYYQFSPRLAQGFFSHDRARKVMRFLLDEICKTLQ